MPPSREGLSQIAALTSLNNRHMIYKKALIECAERGELLAHPRVFSEGRRLRPSNLFVRPPEIVPRRRTCVTRRVTDMEDPKLSRPFSNRHVDVNMETDALAGVTVLFEFGSGSPHHACQR